MNRSFQCMKCNKNYSSKSSLCNHNKKFHNTDNKNSQVLTRNTQDTTRKSQEISSIDKPPNNETECGYNCRFCNKKYKIQQSRWYHETVCKEKQRQEKEKEEEKHRKEQEIQLKEKENLIKEKELDVKLKITEEKILRHQLRLQNSTV
jgi:hypothetical protein